MTPSDLRRFIGVAPNGGRRGTIDHDAIPLVPQALAQTAVDCQHAGAAMIHLHVRDDAEGHSLDPERYRAAIAAVRDSVGDGLIIQVTSESVGRYDAAAQRAAIAAVAPEAASFGLRELAGTPDDGAHFAAFLAELRAANCAVQIILYDSDDIAHYRRMVDAGLLAPAGVSLLYVLGRYGRTDGQAKDLLPLVVNTPPARDIWVCTFGAAETRCLLAGAAFGAHLRIGFENNLWMPDGQLAANNAALIRANAAALTTAGYVLGSAHELRTLWNISLDLCDMRSQDTMSHGC